MIKIIDMVTHERRWCDCAAKLALLPDQTCEQMILDYRFERSPCNSKCISAYFHCFLPFSTQDEIMHPCEWRIESANGISTSSSTPFTVQQLLPMMTHCKHAAQRSACKPSIMIQQNIVYHTE
jgi:hypothetical protein